MNQTLLSAGILSIMASLIHLFLGGRSIARPLLNANDLQDIPKYTQYYCWHIVTIVLAMMGVGYFYAAVQSSAQDVALIMTTLAASFCILGLILPLIFKQPYKHMPQGWMFLPITLLGIIGVVI